MKHRLKFVWYEPNVKIKRENLVDFVKLMVRRIEREQKSTRLAKIYLKGQYLGPVTNAQKNYIQKKE